MEDKREISDYVTELQVLIDRVERKVLRESHWDAWQAGGWMSETIPTGKRSCTKRKQSE